MLWASTPKGYSVVAQGKQPRLDVKKDPKGMVTVPGATVLEVTSAKQLWAAIESGQKNRHVAATQVRAAPLVLPTLLLLLASRIASIAG